MLLPGRHAINLAMLAGNVGAMAWFFMDPSMTAGLASLATTTALSSAMGIRFLKVSCVIFFYNFYNMDPLQV